MCVYVCMCVRVRTCAYERDELVHALLCVYVGGREKETILYIITSIK